MPKNYTKQPPVECEECGGSIQRTRRSRSGRYFCSKPACRAAKQRAYREEFKTASSESVKEQIAVVKARDAEITFKALYGERARCPACGLVNAIPNELHLGVLGEGCNGTWNGVNAMSAAMVGAIWPAGKREFS